MACDGRFMASLQNDTGSNRAFRWESDASFLDVGLSGSLPLDISADGRVIAGAVEGGDGELAFRWTDSTGASVLGDLPGGGTYSHADGVSGDGQVVVGYSRSSRGTEAFRWTEAGGMEGLGDLAGGGFGSAARAATYDGGMIVGTSVGPAGSTAMIWTVDSGMRSLEDLLTLDYGLDLGGWDLITAADVTPDGSTVIGRGRNPSGQTEAWMVSGLDLGVTGPIPGVPEPHTLAILGIGLVALGAGLGRRRHAA